MADRERGGSEAHLRAATASDADAIAELHAASWRATYRGAMRDAYLDHEAGAERRAIWRERLGAPPPGQHVVVAEDDGMLVGFGCAYGDAAPDFGTELDNLHVRPEAQGRGVGARLLGAVARFAATAHPGHGLYLWVLDGNARARRFYERLGARDAGGDVWHAPDGSALAVRRYVWPPAATVVLAEGARSGSGARPR